jgi:opacity protein-like surface antigen
MGRHGGVQPYVGGGVAVVKWRYSEFGDFVDFNTILPDGSYGTFNDTFTDEGTDVAPVAFGGVRFAATDNFLVGGEFRWQGGETSLDPELGFAGDRLSLGGYTAAATFQVRF